MSITERQHTRHSNVVDCTIVTLEERSTLTAGVIIDVSECGVALLLAESLPIGTFVSVRHGNLISIGEVRSCVVTAHGFRLGIQVEGRDSMDGRGAT